MNLRPGYTTFVAPVGEGTIFGGTKPVTFGDITDGTSNTIFFVEVKPERAVPWTAPFDYSFKPANPGEDIAIGTDGHFWLSSATAPCNCSQVICQKRHSIISFK